MYFLYNLKGIKEKCENLPFLKNKTIPTNSAKRFGKKKYGILALTQSLC